MKVSIFFSGSNTSSISRLQTSKSCSMHLSGSGGVILTGIFFLLGWLFAALRLKSSASSVIEGIFSSAYSRS
jgi:hypothetical protein